jgi:hypothetical protein
VFKDKVKIKSQELERDSNRRLEEISQCKNFKYCLKRNIVKMTKGSRMHGVNVTQAKEDNCLENVCKKPEGKRVLRRNRRRWENNIKWILKKHD